MARTYRVGIIGRTGKGNYGHGLDVVWKGVASCEVVAVADDNKSALAGAMTRTGATKAYVDYREMLDKEKPDIVSISQRWIDRHHEMLMAAIEMGCHVYMEKPFVRDLVEADAVVEACEKKHVKLAIAHGNRYSPQVQIARKLIADGQIGQVLELRGRGKEDSRRGGGEDLWVLGTHMLDLMRVFGGDVESCFARCFDKGVSTNGSHVYSGNEGIGPLAGDTIDASYRFKSGINGFFSSHRGQGNRFGLKVFGSKGVIEFQSGYGKTAWLLRDAAWSPGRSGAKWEPISSQGVGKPEPKEAGHGSNHVAVVDLIDAIEKDRQPVSSVYDARAATEMIVSVFESHRQGRPVAVPLENRRNPLTLLGD